jgi:hypothetical protein
MKKLHAALIRLPETPEGSSRSVTIPEHLLKLAAFFPDEYALDIVDLNLDRLSYKRIAKVDFVYVSANDVQKKLFVNLVSACNRLGIPVAAGGELIEKDPGSRIGVAFSILKEGVATIADFAEDFIRGTARPLYAPKQTQSVEGVRGPRYELVNGKRYPSPALKTLPDFARDLLKGFRKSFTVGTESV